MEIDHQRLGHWLKHFGVESHGLGETQDDPLHASGHASGTELLDIIHQIRPQRLVPIHTQDPCFFLDALAHDDIEVVLPACDRPLTVLSEGFSLSVGLWCGHSKDYSCAKAYAIDLHAVAARRPYDHVCHKFLPPA